MFELIIKDNFDAAHFLKNYRGKCETLHGHTWRVEAVFEGEKPNKKSGLLADFKDLKKILWQVLKKLDHSFLNENKILAGANPSCENITRIIFEKLKKLNDRKFKNLVKLTRVTVWESVDSGVTYYEK